MRLQFLKMLGATMILAVSSFISPQLLAQEDDSAALVAIIDAVEKGWEQGGRHTVS